MLGALWNSSGSATAIALDGVAREAYLVATSDVWAAGLRTGGGMP